MRDPLNRTTSACSAMPLIESARSVNAKRATNLDRFEYDTDVAGSPCRMNILSNGSRTIPA
ncbi:MAG TPA: hypothetical protein VGQ36_17250 [Thermoanaerobaculia bacterium]|nr:hypothetical protein [Thermoanaerobaculia bacterium]